MHDFELCEQETREDLLTKFNEVKSSRKIFHFTNISITEWKTFSTWKLNKVHQMKSLKLKSNFFQANNSSAVNFFSVHLIIYSRINKALYEFGIKQNSVLASLNIFK